MKPLRLTALVLLVSLALASAQDTTYALIWKPKAGQKHRYAISLATTIQGADVEFGSDLMLEVKKVESNGNYTLQSSYANPTIRVNGQTQPLEEGEGPQGEIEEYDANGKRLNEKSDDASGDAFSLSMQEVLAFNPPDKPVKIGETWSKEVKADEKKKSHAARIDYKAGGLEKVGTTDVVRVNFTYAQSVGEHPIKATGAFFLEVADGSMVKTEATIDNVQVSDGVLAVAKVKMDRK